MPDVNTTAGVRRSRSGRCGCSGLVIMIDQIDQNVLRGVASDLQKDLHLSDLQIGLLLSAFVFVNGLISVPAGYLADRFIRTRTVGHTVVAWSGITAITAAMPNFPTLLAVRGALGFGQAITEPCCASAARRLLPRRTARPRVLDPAGVDLRRHRSRRRDRGRRRNNVGLAIRLPRGGLAGLPGGDLRLPAARTQTRRGRPGVGGCGRGTRRGLQTGIVPLFEHGFKRFFVDMIDGLKADMRTIWQITTMRTRSVGVSTLLFTITAAAAALPQFYEEAGGVKSGAAEGVLAALDHRGRSAGRTAGRASGRPFRDTDQGCAHGHPRVLLAGRQRVLRRLLHSRSPARRRCSLLEGVGLFVTVMAVPALRAGLSDAVPAHLRGAGFGAFNLVSVVFGQAAASAIVFGLAGAFDHNFRTALIIVSPPVFIGALVLLKARDHLDADAAKIFEAIVKAMQEQQAAQRSRRVQTRRASRPLARPIRGRLTKTMPIDADGAEAVDPIDRSLDHNGARSR